MYGRKRGGEGQMVEVQVCEDVYQHRSRKFDDSHVDLIGFWLQ
jgi:hypothetical protein